MAPRPRAAGPGPVGRIIAGSLAAGVVTALVLTLVVFAGGTESIITGAVLLAFAFGWALIAVLTVRHTEPPAALGGRPRDRDGRHRARAAGAHSRTRHDDLAELGLAAGGAGARGVDVRPDASLPDRCRTLVAHSRHRRPGARSRRRDVREHRAGPRPGRPSPPPEGCTTSAATGCTSTATATAAPPSCSPTAWARSPPPGPGSPGPWPRPPACAPTTAPDRAGARRRATPRTASPPPRTCTLCSPPPARPAPSCWSATRPEAPTP